MSNKKQTQLFFHSMKAFSREWCVLLKGEQQKQHNHLSKCRQTNRDICEHVVSFIDEVWVVESKYTINILAHW